MRRRLLLAVRAIGARARHLPWADRSAARQLRVPAGGAGLVALGLVALALGHVRVVRPGGIGGRRNSAPAAGSCILGGTTRQARSPIDSSASGAAVRRGPARCRSRSGRSQAGRSSAPPTARSRARGCLDRGCGSHLVRSCGCGPAGGAAPRRRSGVNNPILKSRCPAMTADLRRLRLGPALPAARRARRDVRGAATLDERALIQEAGPRPTTMAGIGHVEDVAARTVIRHAASTKSATAPQRHPVDGVAQRPADEEAERRAAVKRWVVGSHSQTAIHRRPPAA